MCSPSSPPGSRGTDTAELPPFHVAFPVDDLAAARHFYGTVLGCREGRSDTDWIDFDLFGQQIVAHNGGTRRADCPR